MSKIPIALQMYTVRDEAGKDFVGTLRKVASIGYSGVGVAGTGGLSASQLRAVLGDLNLEVAGSHVGLDQLENNLEAVIEYNIELVNRFIVCPYLPEDRRRNGEDYRRLGDLLNKIG